MKNIFVLPTDKPSRLYEFGGEYHLQIKSQENFRSQHIYIPSDEKPKEGDWVITPTNDIIQWAKVFQPIGKKIILTTDPTLIADGVQAIDDEFLQWFIKNPSCVFVEVSKICQKETISEWWTDLSDKELREVYIKTGNFHLGGWGHDIGPTEEDVEDMYLKVHNLDLKELNFNVYYKIIIPSEEPKQDRTCSNNCSVVCGECQILEHKQEPCDNCNNDVCCCTIKKQETIEDGANKWVFETNADRWSNNDDTVGDNYGSFIAGAKSDAAKNYWYAKFKDENDQRIKK
jgi:hypothetical protein